MAYQASNQATGVVLNKFYDVSNDLSAFWPSVHRRRALISAAKSCFTLNVERPS